ncbi:MAG: hypothetical protein WB952_23530 [Terriglobales bacterium]
MTRNAPQLFWMALILGTMVVLPGCPGAKPAPISGYNPLGSVNVVVIVPDSTIVGTGSQQQFTALINNSGVSAVQWEVNGSVGGGADVGTISSSGMYTAPQFIPSNPHVTITALADADNTKSGSAKITITGAPFPATVTISPVIAAVQIGKTLDFSAAVIGPAVKSVHWAVNLIDNGDATVGRIVATGKDTAVYTAPELVPNPAKVEIEAISNSDLTSQAVALVTISKKPPNIANVTISPSTATVQAGHSFPFTGDVTGISDTGIIWEVGAATGIGQVGGNVEVGTITTTGVYTAPTQISSTKTVFVTAASKAQPLRTASATVTVNPPLINSVTIKLTPSSVPNLRVGSEEEFTAIVGNTANTAVTWKVNGVVNGNSAVGTISPLADSSTAVVYLAPDLVPAVNPVIISATPDADPTISATSSVNITSEPISVMVTPPSAQVQIGTTQQFTAAVQNALEDMTVTWQVVPNSGCAGLVGSIVASGSMGGLYTAPDAVPPSKCNPVTIEAISNQDHKTFGTATATVVNELSVQVEVTPAAPTVQVNNQIEFTGTVTNSSDPVISDWQVNGIGQANGGGNSTVGIITTESFNTAMYLAPATVPNPVDGNGNGHVTITAVSDANPNATGSTTVTITPAPPAISVTVSPATAVLLPGQSSQFRADVNGTQDKIVNWTLSGAPGGCTPEVCGTIVPSTTNGLNTTYTAPQTVPSNLIITITATADADSTASGTASVTISQNTTLSISVSPANPAPIAAGTASPIAFNAIIANAPPDTNVDWGLGCISLFDSSHPACSIFLNNGGPGCTVINGATTQCAITSEGPGNDTALYTAPAMLYTTQFSPNACELSNDGSGNGEVPLTAHVSYNGNDASATICITVTPPQ